MFVRAEIEFERHEEAVVIPLNALVRRGEERGIFLINPDGQTARFVPVTLGIVNGSVAEVVAPPLSGKVVTMGQHLLEDGSSVLLSGTGPPAPRDKGRGGPPAKPKGASS